MCETTKSESELVPLSRSTGRQTALSRCSRLSIRVLNALASPDNYTPGH